VHVRVDTAGEHQQAIGVDHLRSGQRAADPGDPAVPHPDIGDLAVARTNDRSIADDKVKGRCNHQSILARPKPATCWAIRSFIRRCSRPSERPGMAAASSSPTLAELSHA
jgi:hypothetical protein